MILFARTESCAKYSENQRRLFFSGHCILRNDYSPFSGHRQQIPDSPEKFWTVGNPKGS